MRNEEILEREGVQMLAYWRLEDTEAGHAQALMDLLALPEGARVLDMGCGTGQLARLSQPLRPDLQWVLVNTDAWQLEQCPKWAERLQCCMTDTGLAAGEFDAVVIAYALGYVDATRALEEAARVLKVGGQLLVHELYAHDKADMQLAHDQLKYALPLFGEFAVWASITGFDRLRTAHDGYGAPGAVALGALPVFGQLAHNVSVFAKSGRAHALSGRAALQFSGGKDSLACLMLLRPFVMRGLPVYWTHTGDTIPETLEVIEWARAWVPDFRVVQADVLAWKARHGMPSDVVTAQASWMGQQYAMTDAKLVGRFECCFANLMQPMHQRMLDDKIGQVIRGTKLADTGAVPAQGATDHYEVLLPLISWSHQDVFDYLRDVGAPISAVYDTFKSISAPECLHCSAWWDDGKAAYLKSRHPDKVPQYQVSLQAIRAELTKRMQELDSELQEIDL